MNRTQQPLPPKWMVTVNDFIVIILVLTLFALVSGCATSRLEQRISELERQLAAAPVARSVKTARAPTAPVAPAPLLMPAGHVMSVDHRPTWCNGALCLEITNAHENPALVSVDGVPVIVSGPTGPLMPAGSRGYVRFTARGNHTVTYQVLDVMPVDGLPALPMPTVLAECRIDHIEVGRLAAQYWGQTEIHLESTRCR